MISKRIQNFAKKLSNCKDRKYILKTALSEFKIKFPKIKPYLSKDAHIGLTTSEIIDNFTLRKILLESDFEQFS
jgi:hypothetical protein